MLGCAFLSANSRNISCDVTVNSDYTPGQSSIIGLHVEISSGEYADYITMEFPEGFTITGVSPMGSNDGSVDGQEITWGTYSWTPSGWGDLHGSYDVNIAVDVASNVTGDQVVDLETMSSAVYDYPDVFNGTFTINQLATGPIINVSTDDIYVGESNLNETITETITISNIGIDQLDITNVVSSNSNFTVGNDYSSDIEAGESFDLEIDFIPTNAGIFETDITIASNGGLDQVIHILGVGKKSTYFVESFETGFPPVGWQNDDDDWSSNTSQPFVGEKHALLTYDRTGILSTPKLLIESGDKITFFSGNSYITNGSIVVKISSDRETWTTLQSFPLAKGYQGHSIDLSAFAGSYYLGFTQESDRQTKLDQVIMPQIDMAGVLPEAISLSAPADNATNSELDTTLEWGADGFATGYYLSFGTNENADNILDNQDVNNVTEYAPTLDWGTEYFWKVQGYNANGSGAISETYSFTTANNPIQSSPYTEDFSDFLPEFWTKAKGELDSSVEFTASSSNWAEDGFANDGEVGAARMNIYDTGRYEWLITPTIDLGSSSDLELNFDIALTQFSGSDEATLAADDKVAVVISTDNGATWSENNVLREWRSTDAISNTGDEINIDLSSYTGMVKIGFYAESTVAGGDINVYIDNVAILPGTETPIFSVTPESAEFDEIMTGSTSESVQFEISNSGTGTLRIDNITLEDDTNFELQNLPATFPAEISSSSITIDAVYSPQNDGDHTTNIQFVTNSQTYNVELTGSAYTPEDGDLITNAIDITLDESGSFTATGSNADMKNDYDLPSTDGKDLVYKLTLANNADVDITLEGTDFDSKLAVYAVSADPNWVPTSENYLFYNDNYEASRNRNSRKTSRAIWSALNDMELAAGEYYVVIDCYGNAEGNYTIAVNADVQSEDAEIEVTPESIDFTEMVIGENTDYKTFTITNGGETSYTIQEVNIDNEDDFEFNLTSELPQEISDNEFGVTVRFTPQTTGDKTATLTVVTSAGNKTFTVSGTALNEGMIWESFEDENIFPAAGWTTIDVDGDEHSWHSWSGSYARTGNRFAQSNSGSMWGQDYDPDNWMITPKLSVRSGDKFIYYVRPMNPAITGDTYEVSLSTTGNSATDFTVQLFTENVTAEIWAQREIDLSAYAGQEVYIGFHHINNDDDCYSFAIDDVFMPPVVSNNVPAVTELVFPEDDQEYIYGMTSLSWVSTAYATGYKLSVGTDNPPTNILDNEDIGNVVSKAIHNLDPETTYFWKVTPYNANGDAANAPIWQFTTDEFDEYTQPYSNNFNDCTSMPFFPLGWTDFKGLIDETNTELSVNTFAGWVTSNFANLDAPNKALAIDLYGDEVNNWAITPTIDLGSDASVDYQVRFDMAYNRTSNSEPGIWGADDKVALVISTDNGITWSSSNILEVWNQNNSISSIGQPCAVELSGYSGKIRLAFYAESTNEIGSGEIFIDNFVVGEQIDEPLINILPNNAAFGLTQSGSMSAAKTFRVSNIGIDTLFVSSVAISGDNADQFALVDGNTYPAQVTDGQITFNVIFHPTSVGNKETQIVVTDQNGEHTVDITGYAYGTNGDTIDDPIIVEFTDNLYTGYGNTINFEDDYLMPYDAAPVDSNDVVYKVTLENDVTMHVGLSDCTWDTQLAVYPADVTPGPDNMLYYNDDAEEMRYTRSGDNRSRETRGYNSVITQMHLQAGSYFIVVDGSKKTGWFDAAGEYRIDIQAFAYAAPSNLTGTLSDNNVELAWTAPTIIDGTLSGYIVVKNGFPVPGLVTTTSFTDTDIVAGYNYQYAIIAVYDDMAGISYPSNIVEVTTGSPVEDYVMDSFEDYSNFSIDFEPWTNLNLDGANSYGIEGFEWDNMAESHSFMVYNPTSVQPAITIPQLQARTGSKFAAHFGSENVANDDWIISQELVLGSNSSLNFFAKTFTSQYGVERFRVAVSTTDTDPASFTYLDSDTLHAVTKWRQYIYDLSDYDNQTIYVGIHVTGTEGFIFMMDDFNVRSEDAGVDNENNPEFVTELNGNYPNPFNPTTNISFSLAKDAKVKLTVYNIKGQRVKTLVNEEMKAGKHSIQWNGKDNSNRQTATGVYFYRMETDNFKKVNKMLMMK
jgi:hypothetical protein